MDFTQYFINFSGAFWEETQFLVLTEMCANEILVLNTLNDKVYRVDFEGDHEALGVK